MSVSATTLPSYVDNPRFSGMQTENSSWLSMNHLLNPSSTPLASGSAYQPYLPTIGICHSSTNKHHIERLFFHTQHLPSEHAPKEFFEMFQVASTDPEKSFQIVGVSLSSSSSHHQEGTTLEPNCAFYSIEEVYWLSSVDSKLVPCPSFSKHNLHRLRATLTGPFGSIIKNNISEDFLFGIVVGMDLEAGTVDLSREFEFLLKTTCLTFPVRQLLTNQPPHYASSTERDETLRNQFNHITEKEAWFRDHFHSNMIQEQYFGNSLPDDSNQGSIDNTNPTSILNTIRSSWYDSSIENLGKFRSIREYQDQKYSINCVLRGVDCSKQKDYDRAIKYYQEALSYCPNSVEALVGIGSALYSQKQYNNAVQEFERALALQPNHEIAQQYLEKTKQKLEAINKRNGPEKRKYEDESQASTQHRTRNDTVRTDVETTLHNILHGNSKKRKN